MQWKRFRILFRSLVKISFDERLGPSLQIHQSVDAQGFLLSVKQELVGWLVKALVAIHTTTTNW